MTAMKKKVEIIIWDLPAQFVCSASCGGADKEGGAGCGDDGGAQAGTGCGCGGGGGMTLQELRHVFPAKYRSLFDFTVREYTPETRGEVIAAANGILAASGERLRLSEETADFILAKISPLVAADGRVVSIRNLPGEAELLRAIASGERIAMKPSCY